jgi:methylenetetrahydrofolate dehydrogenase (NADP+)/methenyltetrahydrofolate cyclohydrolase
VTAQLIDGKSQAAQVRGAVGATVAARLAAGLRAPGLVTILVGDDPASRVYVGSKNRESQSLGMVSESVMLDVDTTQRVLEAQIHRYNQRADIDGILVQLPLPAGLDADAAIAAVDPSKDVDGLHSTNQGFLFRGVPGMRPCTPLGCLHLIDSTGVDTKGAQAVVVGRSVLVGKPVAMLLLLRDATVAICHSRTRNLAEQVAAADIVIAACGSPELVRGAWIKPGAVVIDVGINRVNGRLVGDVEFEAARERAGYITPVPGGVGPMTVAMLLRNTLDACVARERTAGRE